MILLLFLCAVVVSGDLVRVFSEIDRCPGDETDSTYPSFSVQDNFSICCLLGSNECSAASLTNNLTLQLEACSDGCPNMALTRMDPCLVKLEVKNASVGDTGEYVCSFDDIVVVRKILAIFDKPETPVITSFVCTIDKQITVTFDRGVPSSSFDDSYEVFMIEERRNISMCIDTNICERSSQYCVCQYADNDNNDLLGNVPQDNNVTIIVIARREVQIVETRNNFSIMANILPGPLKRLKVVQLAANSASVQFCVDYRTKWYIINYTTYLYHLWLLTKEGVPEFLNVTIPSKPNSRCVLAHLSQLNPFTNYTVVVFASGGGGQGTKSMVDFQTKMTAPTSPPKIDTFGFSRYSEGEYDSNPPILFINWHQLPQAAQGGSDLSYTVQVTSESHCLERRSVSETYTSFSNVKFLNDRMSVKIWAQNVVGLAEIYTELTIPQSPVSSTVKPVVHCEFNGKNASIYIFLNGIQNVAQLSIHWCHNYMDTKIQGISICQEYPETVTFNVTEDKVMQFEITLSKMDNNPEVTENRIFEYTDLDKLDQGAGISQTINATRILYGQEMSKLKDYDFYEDTFDPDYDHYYYYESSLGSDRGKVYDYLDSSATKSNFRLSCLDDRAQNGLDILAGKTAHEYPKVFVSLKMQDGLSPLGMVPVNCYFDINKEEVFVTPKQRDQDKTSFSLQWNQKCDKKEPLQQFRADYFHIFPSLNENCKENISDVVTELSRMDRQNVIVLQKPAEYACFRAYKYNSSQEGVDSSHLVQDIATSDSADIAPGVVVASVLASVAAAVILGLSVYCCNRRRNHIRKTFLPVKFIDMPQQPVNLESSVPKTIQSKDTVISLDRESRCLVFPEFSDSQNVVVSHTDSDGTLDRESRHVESSESESHQIEQESHSRSGVDEIVEDSSNNITTVQELDETAEQQHFYQMAGISFTCRYSESDGSYDSQGIGQSSSDVGVDKGNERRGAATCGKNEENDYFAGMTLKEES